METNMNKFNRSEMLLLLGVLAEGRNRVRERIENGVDPRIANRQRDPRYFELLDLTDKLLAVIDECKVTGE